MNYWQRQAGVTLTELLVVSAISVLVILAISAFVIRVYDLPAFQLEQGRITTDLRVEMERMSDNIREGIITSRGSNSMTVDVNGTVISYEVSGGNLQIDGTPPQILARGVKNEANGVPTFRYFSFGGPKALELDPGNLGYNDEIGRVEINLIIDTDPNQKPGEAAVSTVVHRRKQPL